MIRHFEQELERLRGHLIRMGALVDDQLDNAYRALFDGMAEITPSVVSRDVDIDAYDMLIDRECQRIFALAQPVAMDLRLLMSSLNINSQLERMGDIAVNIAERADPLHEHGEFLRGTRLREMADIARIMVRDSLTSFVHGDSSLATRVLESDDVVDRMDRQIFQAMVGHMQSRHDVILPASHIIVVSRHLERLADHATNIAEDVVFLIEAKVVKHHAFEEVSPPRL